jgi:hypothetical protein
MIVFINTSLTVTLKYVHSLKTAHINDCLRFAPFLTGLRVSSLLVTDLVLLYFVVCGCITILLQLLNS